MTIAEMKRQQFDEIAAEIERQNGVYVLERNDVCCYAAANGNTAGDCPSNAYECQR